MSDKQLRDELVTFVSAGRGTTAAALTWVFYILAIYPDVASTLLDELATKLADRLPIFNDLANLHYTERVVKETMRLFPPVWILGRRAITEDEVCGFFIPANAIVLVSPYVIHRNPTWWPNPERFDPNRFLPNNSDGRPRFAYFPFGGGPHLCIGKEFAMMTILLVVATVLKHYRIEILPGSIVEPAPLVGLTPRTGLQMTVYHC
jgi:cytochrome P450